MKKGMLLVFEGGEGSGKTTASKKIVERLRAEGIDAEWTREPGGTPRAEEIRKVLLAPESKDMDPEKMLHLFFEARQDHLTTKIAPGIAAGKVFVSDRFDASTWAYQVVAFERPQLAPLFWKMRNSIVKPVVDPWYFLFHVDPVIGLARVRRRAEDKTHFDERELRFHQALLDGYLQFFGRLESNRISTIDAGAPQEVVFERALHHVRKRLVE